MILLQELQKKIKELPPLPDVAIRLSSMVHDSSLSADDLVEVIKLDPAITIKILRLSNSPFYGLPRKITSLQEALVYLGTDALVNFVLAGCLSNLYCQDNSGYNTSEDGLWHHSIGAAIACQKVADRAAPELSALAYTCGLLHDVGKMILSTYISMDFNKMVQIVEERNVSFLEAEKLVIGHDHAEVGAAIAESWDLPIEIINAIRYHHDPRPGPSDQAKLLSIIHVGNILCMSLGLGIGIDGLAYIFHPWALAKIGLHVNDLLLISIEILEQYHNTESVLTNL